MRTFKECKINSVVERGSIAIDILSLITIKHNAIQAN